MYCSSCGKKADSIVCDACRTDKKVMAHFTKEYKKNLSGMEKSQFINYDSAPQLGDVFSKAVEMTEDLYRREMKAGAKETLCLGVYVILSYVDFTTAVVTEETWAAQLNKEAKKVLNKSLFKHFEAKVK